MCTQEFCDVLKRKVFHTGLQKVCFTTFFLILNLLSSKTATANVVGSDAQNFNPTSNGLDFVTVQSSETLRPGIFNLGLFLNHAVNSLPYFESTPGSRLNFTDSLTSFDFNAGVGLMKDWDIGFSLPQVIRQQVDDGTSSRGEFSSTGITEVRFNTKFRFFGDSSSGLAAILSSNLNLVENNPYSGQNSGPTINFELAGDATIRRWAIGANFGYRARSKGTKIPGSIADPLGDQWIASAAASYHFPAYSTKVISEIFGAVPSQSSSNFSERSASSFEWLLGVKHDVNTNLALHAGGGTELLQGVASPDWRIYFGLNYAFGPLKNETPSKTAEPNKPTVTYLEVVPVTVKSSLQERFRTRSIQFEFDSDKMIGRYDEVLKELVDALRRDFKSLRVEGHTDSVGPSAYNEALSLKRANAIRRRLVEKFGLQEGKIQALGYGETRPIEDNGNYQGRQANRRVEFEVDR